MAPMPGGGRSGGRALADLLRRFAALVRIGLVCEAAPERARVRVAYDRDAEGRPVESGWLPWLAPMAGADRSWRAPSVGEQVVVLSPNGEAAAGVVLGGLYRSEHPAPSADADKHLLRYRDGAVLEYDAEAHRLAAALPAGASIAVESPDGVSVTGDFTITGDLTVTGDAAVGGDLAADGDVTADGNVTADGEVSDGKTLSAMRRVFNRHVHTVPPAGVPPGSPIPADRM